MSSGLIAVDQSLHSGLVWRQVSPRLVSGFVVTDAASLGRRLVHRIDGEVGEDSVDVGVGGGGGGGGSGSSFGAVVDAATAHWHTGRLLGAGVNGSQVCVVRCGAVWCGVACSEMAQAAVSKHSCHTVPADSPRRQVRRIKTPEY